MKAVISFHDDKCTEEFCCDIQWASIPISHHPVDHEQINSLPIHCLLIDVIQVTCPQIDRSYISFCQSNCLFIVCFQFDKLQVQLHMHLIMASLCTFTFPLAWTASLHDYLQHVHLHRCLITATRCIINLH